MKAPDEIFIDEDLIAFHILQTRHEGDVEYLRKDALLEWAKKKKQELFESEPTDVAAGMNAAYDFVIDKLNSM